MADLVSSTGEVLHPVDVPLRFHTLREICGPRPRIRERSPRVDVDGLLQSRSVRLPILDVRRNRRLIEIVVVGRRIGRHVRPACPSGNKLALSVLSDELVPEQVRVVVLPLVDVRQHGLEVVP